MEGHSGTASGSYLRRVEDGSVHLLRRDRRGGKRIDWGGCAQLASTTYSRELNGESAAPWTSWTATWGGWGRQRVRVLTARDGTRFNQTEKQILN